MSFRFEEGFADTVDQDFVNQGFAPKSASSYDFSDLGRSDAVGQALGNESLIAMGTKYAFESAVDWFDPAVDGRNRSEEEFTTTTPEWEKRLNSLSIDGRAKFMEYGAQNEAYAIQAFRESKEFDRRQAHLASLGYEGTAYRVLGAAPDLVASLLIAPETGGGPAAAQYARMGRILNSTFTRRMVTGGTIEGLLELGRKEMSDESRSDLNLILAVGLGAIARGTFIKSPDAELIRMGNQVLERAAAGKDVTKLMDRIKGSFTNTGDSKIDAAVEKLQYDLASVTHRANSQTFREFGDKMYYSRVGDAAINKEEGKIAFEESKDLLEQEMYNTITRETRPVMTSIAQLSKRGIFKTLQAHWDPQFQKTLNEIMGDLQLGKLYDPEGTVDDLLNTASTRLMKDLGLSSDEALAAAKQLLRATENIAEKSHDIYRRGGSELFQSIDGVSGIAKNKNYMPLVHDNFKMTSLIRTHGRTEVAKWLQKSITSALKQRDIKVNASQTKAVAIALMNKIGSSDDMGLLTKMNPDTIKKLLGESTDLDGDQIQLVASLLAKPKGNEATGAGSKYEKTRGIFDYSIKHTTAKGVTIGFRDTLSNNFEANWFPYARTQAGFNALEKLGLKSDTERSAHRAKIHDELRFGDEALSDGEIKKEMAIYDETIRELMGKPLAENPFGQGAQALRSIKNMNVARYLGQTFWTMSAEMGSTIWNTGLVHFIRATPMMGQLIKQFKTGKFDDELMQEIYTHLGLMGEMNRGIGFSKYEHDFAHVPAGGSAASKKQGALNKFEKVSDQFKEAALMIGGIKPLTAFFEAATSSGLITKMMKIAQGGKVKGGFATTMKEMGFTGQTLETILLEMRRHVKTTDSKAFGPKVKKLNMEDWDPAVRELFIQGIKRMTNTIVQRSTLGDKVGITIGDKLVQNTVVGKLGLEMKGYVLNSWSKQLGRALTRRDLYSLGLLTTQMGLGALAYMAQVHTNYPHDPKKRAELLKPEAIAKATFARSSMASWLPSIIDTGAATRLYEPQFKHARSSGLASDVVSGMPVVDLLNTAGAMVGMPATLTGFAETDAGKVKAATRLLPLNNAFGVRALQESYIKDLGNRGGSLRGF